jgi:prepilin-type N-terminal cleavage/methylation domain-containing protein
MFQYVGLTPSTQHPVAAVYDRRPLSAFSPREGEATSPGSAIGRRPPAIGGSASPRSPISDLRSSPRAQRPTNSRHQRLATRHGGFAAFTLIELLVVITIISILAGLTLAAMGGIQKRGARAKAESDIQALSAAIEEYRREYGSFPATNSNSLYAELTTDTTAGTNPINTTKVFFEPPPGIVGTNGSQKFFQDPWGAAYRYTTNAAGFFEILSTAGGTNSNQFIRN